MRIYISLFCLLLALISCKNQEENKKSQEDRQTENDIDNPKEIEAASGKYVPEEMKNTDEKEGAPNKNSRNSEEISENTTYIKIDENDANCNCYCLELDMGNNTELCLQEDEIYINTRYSREGDNINMYYVSPSERNTDEELPWQDFDTNTPIAVLQPAKNGNIALDWKGFAIDGELAVDYAIYGKKTLEGIYEKQ